MVTLETVYAVVVTAMAAALVVGNMYALYKHGPAIIFEVATPSKTPEERVLDQNSSSEE